MNYNELPAHDSWAFWADAERFRDENRATYDKLRKVCTRGQSPCGGKVVVRELAPERGRRRFAVVCNPIRLDSLHVALFCDRGWLAYGYRVEQGIICINSAD